MRVLREAVADCETIAFPHNPRKGMKCFRVDKGKLYEFDGVAWKQAPVPVGKLWFDPNALIMKRRCKKGWVTLDVYLREEHARRRESGRGEAEVQAVG